MFNGSPWQKGGQDEDEDAATAFSPVAIIDGVSAGCLQLAPDFEGGRDAADPQLCGNGRAQNSRRIDVSKRTDSQISLWETGPRETHDGIQGYEIPIGRKGALAT